MPIYEFECTACGNIFERLQKLADADPTDCPQCGKSGIKRRLTAPAFRLAGSGWYETDFKGAREQKHNLAGNHEETKPAVEKSTEGAQKAPTKPADTTAAAAPAVKPVAGPSEPD